MADVYALQLLANLANQPCENVLHYECDTTNDPDPSAVAGRLIAGFIAALQAQWLDCLPVNYQLTGYKARRVNGGGGPSNVSVVAAGTTGVGAAAGSSALGPVIVLPYDDGARWRSGRIFMPGIAEDNLTDNQIEPALNAELVSLIGILLTPIANGGNTFELGVWSPTATPPVFHSISEASISLKIGIQNRRLKPVM